MWRSLRLCAIVCVGLPAMLPSMAQTEPGLRQGWLERHKTVTQQPVTDWAGYAHYTDEVHDSERPNGSADGDVALVISEHWDAVYRVCLSRLSDPSDAEDATQETFIEWLRTDRSVITNVPAWLNFVATR